MLGDDFGQVGHGAGSRIVAEQQIEHGHEVALAGAEAAVEISAGAATGADGVFDERESVVETVAKLIGNDVVFDRGFRAGDGLGELEDEIVGADVLGEIEQLAEGGLAGGGGHRFFLRLVRAAWAEGRQARTCSAESESWASSASTKARMNSFKRCCLSGSISLCHWRSEEHTSELQSLRHLVCRLLLEK